MAVDHGSYAYAARGRMLSRCRISGAALSGRIREPRPNGPIRVVFDRLLGFDPIRQGREGVDRPPRLSADRQDRRAVSGTIGHVSPAQIPEEEIALSMLSRGPNRDQ